MERERSTYFCGYFQDVESVHWWLEQRERERKRERRREREKEERIRNEQERKTFIRSGA